jgi:signal transduction histidine kinase
MTSVVSEPARPAGTRPAGRARDGDAADHADATRRNEAARHDLLTFLRWDQVACLAGVVALVATFLAYVRDPILLVEAALVAATALALGLARRPLRRGDEAGAVTVFALVSWAALLGPSLMTPFVEPVMLVAALLPVVLAVPYVRPARLVGFAGLATATSLLVLVLTRGVDVSTVPEAVPRWLPHAVAFTFVPALVALVALISCHHHARLRRTLEDAEAVNRRLAAAQLALAGQAEQIRASRARLAAAIDEERRRIERDLHDGAQQRLLAVALDLAAACTAVEPGSRLANLLASACEGATAAGEELRALARGVYPAALTDHGLAEALGAVLRARPSYRLHVGCIGRFPAGVESAVYFSCVEALQNVTRHAGPDAEVDVSLRVEHGRELVFQVADDGAGFDPERAVRGRGLMNISDRLAVVNGVVEIVSAPGAGTTIRGRIPSPTIDR